MSVETPLEANPTFPDQAVLFGMIADAPETPLVERVLEAFERHAASEADSIGLYAEIAQTSPDPVIALLMSLVHEDELRHHGLLERMAARLRDDLRWTHSPEALPSGVIPRTAGPNETPEVVHNLAKEEHEGVDHLRRLAREVSTLHNGLLALLLEMMALDSEKHEKVMRFIARRLETR